MTEAFIRRGGGSHLKGAGMLVVSLSGVNFGFWSHLGCSGKTPLYLAVMVSFRVARDDNVFAVIKSHRIFLFVVSFKGKK